MFLPIYVCIESAMQTCGFERTVIDSLRGHVVALLEIEATDSWVVAI